MTILDVIESLRKDPWRKFYRHNWKNLARFNGFYITKTDKFDGLTLLNEDPERFPLEFTPSWSDFLATDWREIEQLERANALSFPDAIKYIWRNIIHGEFSIRRNSWRGKRSIRLDLTTPDNPVLMLNTFEIAYQPTVADILAQDWEITS